MKRDSIVITGVGLATSLGTSADDTWNGICTGRDSFSPVPALESPAPTRPDGQSKGGYQAAELPGDFFPDLPREIRYLRWTIGAAIKQSRADEVNGDRCGIVLGTTLHGMRSGGAFLRSGDFRYLKDFLAGNTLMGALDGTDITGEALTTCSACSSSLGSVALAVTLLESQQLDLVICGGYDAISEYAYAGFNSLRLVADDRLRPFAKDRQGMKLGEGYGILVLERESDAEQRRVTPLATVLGFGESADAHHLTQPHPNGEGAAAAVRAALARSGCSIDEIDLICAHATGTPDNDAGEHRAYADVFGDRLRSIPIVGFKNHVGHTLGGAGAVELILAMYALREQLAPPTANTTQNELEFADIHLVRDAPKPAALRTTLNTSLGFGGANTCVILGTLTPSPGAPAFGSEAQARRGAGGGGGNFTTRQSIEIPNLPHPNPPPEYQGRGLADVLITGMGIVLPGAVGNEAMIRRLDAVIAPIESDSGSIPESDYLHLLNARRVRRMSEYVKLTLAAATLALADANVTGDATWAAKCAAVLGSTHAGAGYCVDYYQQIIKGGMAAANPMLFAEGVPNAAAAHLSLMLGLKGACQTILGTRTAGMDAIRIAFLRIATGQWGRALVGAAEEFTPLAHDAYAACGPSESQRFSIGSGAIMFVLESRSAVEARGGRVHGQIFEAKGGRIREHRAVADVAALLNGQSSACHWIGSTAHPRLARLECDAADRAAIKRDLPPSHRCFPELFSVSPLIGIAEALLRRQPESGVLCAGFNGTAAMARLAGAS
ncbi:MAG: beta-ketoacyl-[acyl-carrier-protein] synthase family protein [Phycisphaerae bacterium]|nr:beta-ketoacyl-[acyl-carrier-protein] synthase family protein [Phycisphaerae bacterium]